MARMLPVFTIMLAAANAQPGPEDKLFQAYDCSVPAHKTTIMAGGDNGHCGEQRAVQSVANMTLVLLQKANFLRVPVKTCTWTATSLAFYCGAHDHQAFYPQTSHFDKPGKVTITECRRLWEERIFHGPGDYKKEVFPEMANELIYQPVGVTYIDSWGHLECVGGKETVSGRRYTDMSRSEHATLTLATEEAAIDEQGVVTIQPSGIRLQCPSKRGACVASRTTYLWDEPEAEQSCRLFRSKANPIVGLEATDDNGERTFISTDGNLVRLRLKDGISDCGHVVHPTNFAKLFATTDTAVEVFQRPLHSSEISIVSYANVQDAFLWHSMEAYVQKELTAMYRQECLNGEARDATEYSRLAAEHLGLLESGTVALEDGWFATAGAEAWYRYQCRSIQVLARDAAPNCYAALPVHLGEEDLRKYLAARGKPYVRPVHRPQQPTALADGDPGRVVATEQDFFVHPVTRKLTTEGGWRECEPAFPAMYRNLRGGWLAVTPTLRVADSPTAIADLPSVSVGNAPDYDMEGGGIYDIASVFAMEKHLQNPSRVKDIGYRMAEQSAGRFQPDSREFHAGDFFHELPDLGFGWVRDFWVWLERWSRFSSIALGIFLIWRFLVWVLGAVVRGFELFRLAGAGAHLWGALLPDALRPAAILRRARTWALGHRDAAAEQRRGGAPPRYDPVRFAELNRRLEEEVQRHTDRLDATPPADRRGPPPLP